MKNRQFRHRVRIEELVEELDSNGALVSEWTLIAHRWCRVVPLSARELIAAAATQSKVTARIEMRHCDWITPTMRIVHRGKVYGIEGLLPDMKSGIEYLTLPVSEGVTDGR